MMFVSALATAEKTRRLALSRLFMDRGSIAHLGDARQARGTAGHGVDSSLLADFQTFDEECRKKSRVGIQRKIWSWNGVEMRRDMECAMGGSGVMFDSFPGAGK